ncbi:hypothetical protein EV421DRAFT_1925401 [Armillaria borealis]|uniref:F-box domain-containing protein n=1 Tax=Armillaria borealis TaxID=47425 RepID=A0AA39IWM8_9AGAR|nr:hypothetical protein EV421DRAFT_1925401 [Armillaria borealis]
MSPKTTLYKRSDIEALPLELREEILSHLDFPSIKCLSLTSSILRAVCFRRIFQALYLRGIVTTFLEDLKGQAPMACFHTIKIEGLQQDVSTDLHLWCSKVHTVKIKDANIGNTTILPSLTILKDLDLSDLTFSAVDDYFKLLANLPPTLKKLTVRGIEFKYHQSEPIVDNIVSRGAALEHLETDSAEDLTLLLKDHCPISLKSLRVANVPQARPHDLEVLVQTAPHLIDLRLDISTPEDRPVSLPLTRLKLLSITDRTESVEAIIQLLSSPSDVPSALQVLSFSFPFNQSPLYYSLTDSEQKKQLGESLDTVKHT